MCKIHLDATSFWRKTSSIRKHSKRNLKICRVKLSNKLLKKKINVALTKVKMHLGVIQNLVSAEEVVLFQPISTLKKLRRQFKPITTVRWK